MAELTSQVRCSLCLGYSHVGTLTPPAYGIPALLGLQFGNPNEETGNIKLVRVRAPGD